MINISKRIVKDKLRTIALNKYKKHIRDEKEIQAFITGFNLGFNLLRNYILQNLKGR